MEDFLEVWREYRFKLANTEEPLVGNHCEINIVGDRVHLYPLYEGEWEEIEDAWVPIADVEDMFAAYAAWAYGKARQAD